MILTVFVYETVFMCACRLTVAGLVSTKMFWGVLIANQLRLKVSVWP